MHFTQLVSALALTSSVLAAPPKGNSGSGLRNAFVVAKGRSFIGTALTPRNDTAETAIISNKADFNSITPENAQKWEVTEPARGQFSFAGADEVVNYATSRGYQLHCHTLVWHSQLPPWVAAGNFSKTELVEVMATHINAVAGRYKGKCTRWDVVNEALNEDGSYRSSPFFDILGEEFIPIAFGLAAKADPKAKLYLNDYNIEINPAKAAGTRRIVNLIRSQGARIDGVGLQAHLVGEPTPTQTTVVPAQKELEKVLTGFTRLGLDVAYTEVDVRMVVDAEQQLSRAQHEVQKKAYQRIGGSCAAVKRCVGMTVWGVVDEYSWIPGVFEGEGAALLWDTGYQRKPAYDGFLKGIRSG